MITNSYIINDNLDVNGRLLPFISKFDSMQDVEIATIMYVWLLNGNKDISYIADKIVNGIMDGRPSWYVLSYGSHIPYNYTEYSMWENISETCFHNLILKIKEMICYKSGIRNSYDLYISSPRHRCKYSHDALSLMLSGNTLFPTKSGGHTYYRYNLLMYLFAYKLKIWEGVDVSKALVPCCDAIMDLAYDCGITKRRLKSTLPK